MVEALEGTDNDADESFTCKVAASSVTSKVRNLSEDIVVLE